MNIFKKPITVVSHNHTSTDDSTPTGKKSHTSNIAVIKINPQKQRDNFNELNEIESQRIIEGLNNPTTSIWSLTAGISRSNRKRNRYTNVTPWDRSRVRLPVTDDKSYSDYINASHITLKTSREKITNKYIACQGPLDSTVNHFWSMCFNESEKQGNDVVVIVMVTPLVENGMVKCDKYWPELGETFTFDDENKEDGIEIDSLSVKNVREITDESDDYLVTELELKSNNNIKKVYHFYYYKWADAKVPPSIKPLSDLSDRIHEIKESLCEGENQLVPIIHCSAGVGRSGTFIVYDHLFRDVDNFRKLVKEDGISNKDLIYQAVCQLRSQRMMMVQTVYQYSFLYDAARSLYK
ncbi:PTP1 Tyrosine-protein phosphatase 1 [Candida maltosa Xu316]